MVDNRFPLGQRFRRPSPTRRRSTKASSMDGQRAGTSHSQRAFIPMHPLEHSAPEVVQHHVHEKFQSPPPSRHGSIYPQQQGPYFASPEFEAVPPQYPGTSSVPYLGALVAPPIDDKHHESEKLCGIKRGLFLLLLALGGLLLLAIAIGVGVGVGLSSHNKTAANATTTSSPSSDLVTTSSGLAATSTKSAPSSIATGNSCLELDNTQSSASNGKTFLQLCGVDYSGVNEATDIGNLKASSFEACIEQCAEEPECTGAGWGPEGNNAQYRGICWMKKDLKRSHIANDEWRFAVLLASATTNGSIKASTSSAVVSKTT